MKRNSRAVAVVTALLAMAGSAKAEVLLDLTNSPTQNDTPCALPFVATATTTTLSIAGYQVASGEYATDNGVFASGSSKNLLHKAWSFVPAAQGSGAEQYRDGTRVKALLFEGSDPGYYDTFSQTFTTVVGETYYVDFDFTQGGGASGFEVYTSAVPEPATWTMMLIGLGGLGIARRSRRPPADTRSRRSRPIAHAPSRRVFAAWRTVGRLLRPWRRGRAFTGPPPAPPRT